MDILDIDEVLKDDSFIFLGEKTHDDVSNILQQWKHNTSPHHDQGYKINSRTFTRPKRKPSQNLETKFTDISCANENSQEHPYEYSNGLKMEIGGLVTTFQKSFLQDTSPPPSICSSIGLPVEQINCSLITSSDFSSMDFLQSTQSIHFFDENTIGEQNSNLVCNSIQAENIVNGAKCVQKPLTLLTISNEGAYNKDLQIAQIDDISLTLCKTGSECSTMQSSTESFEEHNRATEYLRTNNAYKNFKSDLTSREEYHKDKEKNSALEIQKRHIFDITFDLKESETTSNFNVTKLICGSSNTNNETVYLPEKENDSIFNLRCRTPENLETSRPTEFCESTPQILNEKYCHELPHNEIANLSPIVSNDSEQKVVYNLNETFSQENCIKPTINSETFLNINKSESFLNKLDNESVLLESKNKYLAETEYNFDKSKNEEEFNCLLDEFSKIELSTKQKGIEKSLQNIKNRLCIGIKSEPSRNGDNTQKNINSVKNYENNQNCKKFENEFGVSMETNNERLRDKDLIGNKSDNTEVRLLSRRSRLYDNVDLKTLIKTTNQNFAEKEPTYEDKNLSNNDIKYLKSNSNYKISEKRERDRDRFKTIKIDKKYLDEDNKYYVPCISDNEETMNITTENVVYEDPQVNNLDKMDASYLIHKSQDDNVSLSNNVVTTLPKVDQSLGKKTRSQSRSLSRPRHIKELEKFTMSSKATSISNLQKVPWANCLDEKNGPTEEKTANNSLKSSMTYKSKSFHNLSNNAGQTARLSTLQSNKNKLFEQRKVYSGRTSVSEKNKNEVGQKYSAKVVAQSRTLKADVEHSNVSRLVSGIRVPEKAGKKLGGLMRPSSGYFSLNQKDKSSIQSSDIKYHSNNHLHSEETFVNPSRNGHGNQNLPVKECVRDSNSIKTEIVSGSIKPPAIGKRSGLPRPTSVFRPKGIDYISAFKTVENSQKF